MSFASCVSYSCRSGREEELLRALAQLAHHTRREPGCLEYRLHRDPENASRFFLYERYVDESAYRLHQASEHFETWAKGIIPGLLDERRIERYVTVDDLEALAQAQ
ncbi:putative quinol monooxygenase [Azospirillum rugosum]|uniref:Quinol monooxygenase YgiN n=1 Tax=Azospirillum rugosum TaxID=416170 RepID=A0ABS4SL13_9PROT|nr:putative quinol monooxygenase [Azospirillum rugosum]MBP2293250.1 quinol monooxygenase YgiN [Azospirillum rugosum]